MSTAFESVSTASSDYAEVARRALEADRCALLVVDIQEKVVAPIFQKEQLVRNAKLLIRAADVLKIPAIVSTQYAERVGRGLCRRSLPCCRKRRRSDKNLFSCFGSDVFCTLLKRLPGKRNTLLLCGMESHICVMADGAGGAARRLHRACRFRRGEFADGMELEDWSRKNARREGGDFFH